MSRDALLNPSDSLERQNEKLIRISEALMARVEQSTDESGAAYAQFQRAALLEGEVRARTRDLERALDLLNESNAQLSEANRETEAARANLYNAIETVQEGFALFNSDNLLVMCNSRFGMHMPDIHGQLVPGLAFRDYVDLVSRSRFLDLPDGQQPQDWAQRRMARHDDDHVMFNVRMVHSRWVQVSEHRTPDGGTVILQTDVSDIMRLERQERERMLDDQARIIRATLEHLNQGICIFDPKGRLVGWNQRAPALLALSARLFRIGTTYDTLRERIEEKSRYLGGVTPQQVRDWVASPGGRRPVSFEMTRGKDTLAVHAREMPDGGFVISFTDVTAERAAVQAITHANEQLEARVADRTLELEDALGEAERANASKSRFVAAASHDLLQPLSAAKLYLSALEGNVPDAMHGVVGKTQRALESVEDILQALLDISKLDSGKAVFEVGRVSLGGILDQLRDEMLPLARAKGLDLRIRSTDLRVVSDATFLRRILQNLIGNAIRYTETGRVLVGVRPRGRAVRVEVWDTGPGIPEDQREAIFTEFRRLDAAASAAEGMGLGLAIVERACARLNHPLELRSEIGRGTGFLVELPLAEDAVDGSHDRHPHFRSRRNDLASLMVLLVENDAEVRQALSMNLEKWGTTVLAVSSGAEASALLAELGVPPDAVIADFQLDAGELGTDVARRLATDHGRLPTCIITANRGTEVQDLCAAEGFELMHKPIDLPAMRGFLSRVAEGVD